jgi:hypothetical protein
MNRRLMCDYDTGSMVSCDRACNRPATHVVCYRNGSYGPFSTPVCRRHRLAMQGRVDAGHIETRALRRCTG